MPAPKQDDSAAKRALWPKLLTAAILVAVTFAAVSLLPRGYSQDTGLIGKGQNVLVLYHDSNAVDSQENMLAMDALRDEYEGRVQFVVADKNSQQGKQFSQMYGINSVALVFFSGDGAKIGVLQNSQSAESLRNHINTSFGP